MSSSKSTPKHAGFVHTVLSDHEVISLLYTIARLLSLYLQLTGQCGTIPCVFDQAAHSLNTKILIYTFYMCFFEVQT